MKTVGALLVAGLLVCHAASANTYNVTTNADSGAGSLRQAILDANANAGADTIAFGITGSGVHTIAPATALPAISSPVTIDGYTQPGSSANTHDVSQGLNTVLAIEIDGAGLPAGSICLDVAAADTTIRGLVIRGCQFAGIRLQNSASNVAIEGCFLGTNAAGTAAASNSTPTAHIQGAAPSNVRIGGTTPAARNLISGGHAKIAFEPVGGVHDLTVQGNLIGTDVTGTVGLPSNGDGLVLYRVTNATVGGTAAGARNVISNNANGIDLEGEPAANILIAGNYIGVDVTGTAPLGNFGRGIASDSPGLTVGGTTAAARNIISNNGAIGIVMGQSGSASGFVVQGNYIGVDATGTVAMGNGDRGLHVGGGNHTIGGIGPGEANIIANTKFSGGTGDGVYLPFSQGNVVRGNSIYGNAGLGIDVMPAGIPEGVTPNDPLDVDTGGNGMQNFPLFTSVTTGASTHVVGVLHSKASTVYDLDFYANACSNFPREFREGQTWLGTAQVTSDGSGNAAFDVTLPATAAGTRISATATDPAGNTSEFSQGLAFVSSPPSGPPDLATSFIVKGTDFAAGAAVTVGGIAATDVNIASATSISAKTPVLSPGVANDIVVTNTDGTFGILPKAFVSDFLDVPAGLQFYSFVTKLVSNGITAGVGGGNYGVDQPTLRQQMAVFLLKAKRGLCYAPPPCTGTFADVPCTNSFAPWIEAMAAEGITGGCGGGNFCPGNPVRRDQMAVFLLKAEHGSSYVPPLCSGDFTDVPCPSPFADWIEQLAAETITGGCGGTNYCPLNPNTRGQMAVFISKTFALP